MKIHQLTITKQQLEEREQIVKFLTEQCEKAANGDYLAISVAAIGADGTVSTGWQGTARGNVWMLVGAVAKLEHELIDRHRSKGND